MSTDTKTIEDATILAEPPTYAPPAVMSGERPPEPWQGRQLGQLCAALGKARGRCKPAPKDAVNQYHKYQYASSEAIIIEANAALEGSGLALVPIESNVDGHDREGPDRYELRRRFLLMHESGQCLPISVAWPICPDKGRPLDKAAAAADTLSLAYLLRDLLQMPRVDPADDVAGRDDARRAAPQQQPQPAKPASMPRIGPEDQAKIKAELARTGLPWAKVVEIGKFKAGTLIDEVPVPRLAGLLEWLAKRPNAATFPSSQPTPADGADRRLPADGDEFWAQVQEGERECVGRGWMRAGELVQHLQRWGAAAQLPPELFRWPAEKWAPALIHAREFTVKCQREYKARTRGKAG